MLLKRFYETEFVFTCHKKKPMLISHKSRKVDTIFILYMDEKKKTATKLIRSNKN